MQNITMTIDEKTLKKVKKIAIEKDTTLTALVRDYLREIAEEEDFRREEVVAELKAVYKKSKVVVGDVKWKREDLYDER